MPYRIAVRFAVRGDLRFLGHQDTMRLFERAAVRAGLPLQWGRGFNPRPHYSLPLPRPVGIATEDDLLVVELDDGVDRLCPDQVRDRLAPQMPEGVELLDARAVARVPQPLRVCYTLDLPGPPAELPGNVTDLLAREEHIVQRQVDARGRTHPVDIRPYIEQLRWDAPAGRLSFTLAATGAGSARPGEVLAAVGLPPSEHVHRLIREQVLWQSEPAEPEGPADRKEI